MFREKIKRGIKSRDSYSLVLDKVQQSKVNKHLPHDAKQDRTFDTSKDLLFKLY